MFIVVCNSAENSGFIWIYKLYRFVGLKELEMIRAALKILISVSLMITFSKVRVFLQCCVEESPNNIWIPRRMIAMLASIAIVGGWFAISGLLLAFFNKSPEVILDVYMSLTIAFLLALSTVVMYALFLERAVGKKGNVVFFTGEGNDCLASGSLLWTMTSSGMMVVDAFFSYELLAASRMEVLKAVKEMPQPSGRTAASKAPTRSLKNKKRDPENANINGKSSLKVK